jgi:hypothetical protein
LSELCGALVFYAHQYVNSNIERYTPTRELEREEQRENAVLALKRYIRQLSLDMASGRVAILSGQGADESGTRAQNGCTEMSVDWIKKEVNKFAYSRRY